MRAVNLVPPESRAGRVSPGKSGGAVYGLLGGLVLLIAAMSMLALAHKSKAQAEQELAAVNQSTAAFEQVASRYSSYSSAAKDASDRIALVRSIADARFDWAGTLRDMARLIPAQTQIATLDASVKDGVSVGGAGSQLRASLSVPAITLKGCSVSQNTVADLVTRLQAMRRVTNVTLETSETESDAENLDKNIKDPSTAGADATGTSTDDSGDNNDGCSLDKPFYSFTITVFFAPGKSTTSDAVGTTPGAGGTAVAATTPATTTGAGN